MGNDELIIPIKETMKTEPTKDGGLAIAEKVFHKGFLHALAESGGNIQFDDLRPFNVRIEPIDGTFVRVLLVVEGRQSTLKSFLYSRPKKEDSSAGRNTSKKEKPPLKQFAFKEGGEEVI